MPLRTLRAKASLVVFSNRPPAVSGRSIKHFTRVCGQCHNGTAVIAEKESFPFFVSNYHAAASSGFSKMTSSRTSAIAPAMFE